MPRIITVAHQKGGVGKSTLALNLAMCFHEEMQVALVDSDLQGSLLNFKAQNPTLNILNESDPKKIDKLPFDLVVIDTPPYLTSTLSELFNISDFVLIPTKTGFFDIMAIRDTLDLVKTACIKSSKLRFGTVLNMVKYRSGITEEVKELLKSLDAPILETIIFDRVSFSRSPVTGGVLLSDDEKAKEEIIALAKEIVNAL